MREADISINGTKLSEAQSTTLRVAATNMLVEMAMPDALGGDAAGRAIAFAYAERLREILTLIVGKRPS